MLKKGRLAGRAPRLGKIKVGEKAEGGRPTSVDYFIIDSEYKDLVTKVYGDKPKLLNIVFPSDDVEDNMKEMYRWYGSSGLKCTGDGETFTQFIDTVKEPKECPCFRSRDDLETKQQCYAGMILSFIITGIGVTGVWHFTSKAVFSRSGIRAIMEMVLATTGKLAGVPFYLRVEMQKSTIADNPHKFPVVSIDCAMDLASLMKQNLQIEPATKILPDPETSKEIDPEPESESKDKFEPEIQHEWDTFHKWLEDNKDKLKQGTYETAMIWLNGLEKPTVEKLLLNRAKIKSQIEGATPSGEYKEYHDSLITNCCEILKTENRLPVIQTLNNMVKAWGVDGLEKLSETSENQCLNLVDEFDKLQKSEDYQDLPY